MDEHDDTERPEEEPAAERSGADSAPVVPRQTDRVRIIGAEEAAAAVEAARAAQRRPEDMPRYGDVPPAPEGPRPAHRFPLPESVDPAEAVAKPPPAMEPGTAEPPTASERDQPVHEPPSPATHFQPTSELPHWTEPPTGEIPLGLARNRPNDGDPAAHTEPGREGPTWRGGEHDWDDASFEPASLADDETRMGALAEEDEDPLAAFSFDDLDALARQRREVQAPEPAAPRGARRVRRRAETDQGAETRQGSPSGPGSDTRLDPQASAGQGAASEAGRPISGRRQGARSPGRQLAGAAAAPTAGGAEARAGTGPAGPVVAGTSRGSRRSGDEGRTGEEEPEGRDLVTAVSSGVAVGIVAVILFKLGSTTALLLCTIVVAFASLELFGVLRRAGYRPATLVGAVGSIGLMVAAYLRGEDAYPLMLGLVTVFALLWYLVGVERARPVANVAVTLLGFAWVGVLGSFAGLLLDPRLYPHRHGVAFVFGAVIATVAYDVGAYAVGRRFGHRLLAPQVSPAKTWEGLIGGTVAAIVVAAVVVSRIHPWDLKRAIALGIVVAVVAPLGDLCESLVKRDLGVKDMGSLVPGHGGLFDRVDALLFVLPATYGLLRLLNVA